MVRIETKAHVGADGTLHLEVPTELREMDVEVLIVLNPVHELSQGTTPEQLGWPPGFFEQTFGSCQDDPITRPPGQDGDARAALMMLVTHNTSEFSRVAGLQLEDWEA